MYIYIYIFECMWKIVYMCTHDTSDILCMYMYAFIYMKSSQPRRGRRERNFYIEKKTNGSSKYKKL